MKEPDSRPNIISELRSLGKEANSYFDRCVRKIADRDEAGFMSLYEPVDEYWDELPTELQKQADELVQKVVSNGKVAAELCRRSALINEVDQRYLSIHIKSMRAALLLRQHHYSETQVIHSEERVHGILPPDQRESASHPAQAKGSFNSGLSNMLRIIQLADVNALSHDAPPGETPVSGEVSRYRKNTAFIMMWMDESRPELLDVKDTVSSVFESFGVKAVRADDIEHQDLITRRIIEEIRTAEFLFADLTGARPSVYYEVGYAHALGKRVILFRRKGAELHFDLAGYNCPAYRNLGDLNDQLSRRLEAMTGKSKDHST